MIRRTLKQVVERRLPQVATGFRVVREEWRAARGCPQPTSLGFWFTGDPSMQNGTFELAETAFLRRCLPCAGAFVDVGAHVGFYTCLARSLGKPVVAVEPLTDNLRYLYRNLLANGWADVEVWPVGLAQAPGLVTLYGGQTGASLVPGWAGASTSFARTIPVTTLDLLLNDRFKDEQLVIKVDVEGAEFALLHGALATLERRPRPIWLMEIVRDEHHPGGNRNFTATFDLFGSCGYVVHRVAADCTRLSNADINALGNGPAAPGHSWAFTDRDFAVED